MKDLLISIFIYLYTILGIILVLFCAFAFFSLMGPSYEFMHLIPKSLLLFLLWVFVGNIISETNYFKKK